MSSRFTEQETENYYDAEDEIYRAVWDEEGSVHWGVFDDSTGDDFLKAGANLDAMMVAKGRIDASSNVLDLGCGNGTIAIWLSSSQGCHVTGVDLSGVRIQNAKDKLASLPAPSQEKLKFEKASATELPFEKGTFSHLWSQATIYHVPDKETVLEEAYRVLKDGGIMVFDDLIKPQPNVSLAAQEFVYDRLLYDTPYSFDSYQDALKAQGFKIIEAQDLSPHLKTSYLRLSERTPKVDANDKNAEHYSWLSNAYQETAKAVDRNELGWGLYICQK